MDDETEKQQSIPPTQLASPYDYPYGPNPYEPTQVVDDYGLPLLAPPPPPTYRKNRWSRWLIMLLIATIVIILGYAATSLLSGYQAAHAPKQPTVKTIPTEQRTSGLTPTSTIATTPTALTIPSSTLTANDLYGDFVNAHLPVASPTKIDNSWWLSIGESYYPARGGVQFTDTNSNTLLQIAVFNTAQAATTDAQEATSSPSGWTAQYIQVNTCVLFSATGPVDIQYFKPTMQAYCI